MINSSPIAHCWFSRAVSYTICPGRPAHSSSTPSCWDAGVTHCMITPSCFSPCARVRGICVCRHHGQKPYVCTFLQNVFSPTGNSSELKVEDLPLSPSPLSAPSPPLPRVRIELYSDKLSASPSCVCPMHMVAPHADPLHEYKTCSVVA